MFQIRKPGVVRLAAGVLLIAVAGLVYSIWLPYRVDSERTRRCILCLAAEGSISTRLFGIPVFGGTWKPAGSGRGDAQGAGQDAVYRAIFGKPCDHVWKGGAAGEDSYFLLRGVMIACGTSAESIVYHPRAAAITGIFAAFDRLGDKQLARDSYAVLDSALPADIDIARWQPARMQPRQEAILAFAEALQGAKTAADWSLANRTLQESLPKLPPLPASPDSGAGLRP